jgi:hypothetical protein
MGRREPVKNLPRVFGFLHSRRVRMMWIRLRRDDIEEHRDQGKTGHCSEAINWMAENGVDPASRNARREPTESMSQPVKPGRCRELLSK